MRAVELKSTSKDSANIVKDFRRFFYDELYTSLSDNNDDIEEDGDDDVDSSGCVCDQLDLESLSGPAP